MRGAHYAPRRVDGRPADQENLETTFVFKYDPELSGEDLEQTASVSDYDARPIRRVPPKYPEKCMRSARSTESIYVEFDVNEKGATENIRIVGSTNSCLEASAIASVKEWTYSPRTVDAIPQRRDGVQTLITYELGGDGVAVSPQMRVRQRVW